MSGNLSAKEMKALLAQSAMPQKQGGLVSYNPVAQGKKAASDHKTAQKEANATPFEQQGLLLDKNRQAEEQSTKSDANQAVMSRILNNPIGHAVGTALGALNVPKSYAVSAVKELTDLADAGAGKLGFDMSTDDHSAASFKEFLKQGHDGIGFGDVVNKESSTAREHPNVGRALGFAGDVAFDPLTYVTFGTGKFAGQAGRLAAGEKVAAALGEEAGARVARLGVMGASAAEREAAFAGLKGAEDLARPGLRFAGQRIPATEKLAEALGTGLSKTRAAIGDTAIGQGLRSIRAPKGLEEAFKVLQRGEGDAGVAFDTIKHVRDAKAGEGMFTGKFANSADKLAHDVLKEGDGVAAFRALDEGVPGLHPAGSSAAKAEKFFADAHALASESVPALGKVTGYVPHVWTPEARKALKGDGFKEVRKLIGMDVTEATGGAVRRAIHPGSKLTMPDGKIIEFVADTAGGHVSARQIQEKLGKALGVKKVIENDLAAVLHPYITGMGESVGRAEALAKAGHISGTGSMVDVVDKAATKAAGNAEAKTLGKVIKSESKIDEGLRKQLVKTGGKVQSTVTTELDKQLTDATAALSAAKASEAKATGALSGLKAERAKVTQIAEERVSAAKNDITEKLAASTDAAKSYKQIDAAQAAASDAKFSSREARVAGEKDVADATKRLAAAKKINVSPSAGRATEYDKIAKDLTSLAKAAGDSPELRQAQSLLTTYAKGVADLRDGKAMNTALTAMQKAASKGEVTPVLKQMIQDGYEKIGESLLGESAPIVKKELAEQLRHLQMALDQPNAFWKTVDKYTQYFKTWATTSPGFHVRNAMQGTFMNASDGVTLKNMGHGTELWRLWEKDPLKFADRLPDYITPEQADNALRAVFASGGGEGAFGAAELKIGQSKLINNHITRFSKRWGGKVEGVLRMGMAVDTILGGGTMEEAAARISRIHFDYSAVSKFDAVMKRLIPFWTFLSRNVPLQMQQMFLKPRVYQEYKHLADNMGHGGDGDMIPLSWQEGGAFQLTKGVFLQPDLAHLQVQADIGKLTTDPQRLLADANPLLKIPFETLIAKRKLFQDQAFQDGQVESVSGSGLEVLEPMLKALGMTDTAGDGTEVMNEKWAYAIRGLNPLAAQSQRFFGDDPYYGDKRSQSILNWAGIPVKQLTKGQKSAEQKRRNRASQAKVDPKTAALLAYSKG